VAKHFRLALMAAIFMLQNICERKAVYFSLRKLISGYPLGVEKNVKIIEKHDKCAEWIRPEHIPEAACVAAMDAAERIGVGDE